MNWWQRLLRRGQMEDQLEKELGFHLEQHEKELMARGESPKEARRLARLALGGSEQVKEGCREARGTRWVEDFLQDLRYAMRTLRKQPAFAAVALSTLALGIGATTVMFTVISGVLLKPLPYPEPDRLITVHGHSTTWNTEAYGEQNVAYPDFLDAQREVRTVELAGSVFNGGTVSAPGDPEYVNLREITPELFSVMGVPLFRGRTFLPEEDRLGATPAVILGYSFWQRRFAGDTGELGGSLVLDGKRYTVVGIASPRFRLEEEELDVFTPIGQDAAGYIHSRAAHPVRMVGRLRPGVKLAEGQAELALIAGHLAVQYPDTNAERTFQAAQMHADVGDVRSTLWLLLGAGGLVLLIACVNVASLLLARAVSRERELAMRVALGASQGRLVRQCLTESTMLGVCAGVMGVVLAAGGIGPFVALWPGSLPRAEEVQLDWRVLLFAVGVSLLSGLLFGLAPALRAPKHEVEKVLRSGGRSVAGSSGRLHSGFVISEIALAMVLLVAAGMLGRTLLRLSSLNPGVNVQNVLAARMALSPATLAEPAKIRAAWQDVLERARRVREVQSASIVDTVPMREGNNPVGYWTNAAVPPENEQPLVLASSVTPEYLTVMGIPLRQGRFFTEQDRMGSEPVVVIDEVMAQEAFGGQDPVGKHVWIPTMAGPKWEGGSEPLRVVGVVSHVRYWGLASDDQARLRAQLYYPFAQVPDRFLRRWSELMSIAVRTGIAPLNLVEHLRHELRGVGGDQVLYEVRTMEELSRGTLSRQRFLLVLFGIFAGLALLLACIGIYGVLAYLSRQRVPEIGVRMVLGASASNVLWLVLRQSLGMVFAGVGAGILGALAAARLLNHLVEGMQPPEVSTFAVTMGFLIVAALLASFLPARRASLVDPVRAIRQE